MASVDGILVLHYYTMRMNVVSISDVIPVFEAGAAGEICAAPVVDPVESPIQHTGRKSDLDERL